MDKYTASNGYTVADGAATIRNRAGDVRHRLGKYSIDALREFFRAERDEELGVWRSKEHAGWSAIRKHTVVYFHHEDHERQFHIVIGDNASITAWTGELVLVAHEYLDAHPEPKPRHEAKDGHLWLIRFDDFPDTDVSALVKGGRFIYNDHCHEGVADLNDPTITAARRIWPEPD